MLLSCQIELRIFRTTAFKFPQVKSRDLIIVFEVSDLMRESRDTL